MTLSELILSEYNKVHAELVADYVIMNPHLVQEMVGIVYMQEEPLSRRGAWSLRILSQKRVDLVEPMVPEIIDRIRELTDVPVLKLVLAVLVETEIPEEYQGEILQFTSEVLTNTNSSIASLIYSMDIFYKLSLNESDLLNELRFMLEQILPYGSPGVKNKCGKLIRKITKQIG